MTATHTPAAGPAPARDRNIEAIYPLTPAQEAFAFHAARAAGTDPGLLQMRLRLRGELDRDAFEEAWRWVLARHPALRSSVHWKSADRPLQVVHRQVELPIAWRTVADADALAAELAADAATPIDPGRAPTLRLTVFDDGSGAPLLCWTGHHVLIDGWSEGIVLQELLVRYHGALDGRPWMPPAAAPFRDYVQWRLAQDEAPQRAWWRAELAGLDADDGLWAEVAAGAGFAATERVLPAALGTAIDACARRLHSTAGLVFQLAWALVVAAAKRRDDLLLGVTVSGRTAPVAGIESMVGLLANALPLRVRLGDGPTVADLLAALREGNRRLADFAHSAPARLHAWGCLPGRQPFDTLLVIQNAPWVTGAVAPGRLAIGDPEGEVTTRYPLTLVVVPGAAPRLRLRYMTDLADADQAAQLVARMAEVLARAVADPAAPLEALRRLAAAAPALGARPDHAAAPAPGAPARGAAPGAAADGILTVWREVLRRPAAGPDDDFFELGGDSLLGLSLLDRLNEVSGRRIPLLALFQAPTPRAMARWLAQPGGAPADGHLIAVRPAGRRRPFFMVHGGSRIAAILAEQLGPEQPLYVFDSHWDRADVELEVTVEAIAEGYLRELRTVQPAGPYLLGGYSMGAPVAFEMARRLHAQGEPVALLFLLDPPIRPEVFAGVERPATAAPPADAPDAGWSPYGGVASKLARRLAAMKAMGTAERLAYLGAEARDFARFHAALAAVKGRDLAVHGVAHPFKLQLALAWRRRGRPIPPALRETFVSAAYRAACSRYRLRPYPGELLVFRGSHPPRPRNCIWAMLVEGRIRYEEFAGHHLDFHSRTELIHRWTRQLAAHVAAAQP